MDEIQRLPGLLNEVHRHIEDSGLRFILTGSSARKLKRAGVNLLGGRAVHTRMYPFLPHELGTDFDLDTVLRHGSLPVIWNADDRAAALRSYVQLYLKGRDQGRSAGAEPGRLRALHAGRRPVSRPDLERGVCRARCRGQPDNPGRLRGYPGGHACGVSSARVRSEAASPGTEAPEAVLDRSRIGTGGGRTLPRSRPAGTGPPIRRLDRHRARQLSATTTERSTRCTTGRRHKRGTPRSTSSCCVTATRSPSRPRRPHGSTTVTWRGSVPSLRCPDCSPDGIDIWPLPDLLEALQSDRLW